MGLGYFEQQPNFVNWDRSPASTGLGGSSQTAAKGMGGMDYLAIGGAISAVGSLFAGFAEADALRAQAEFQKQLAEFNAKLSDMQAADSIERGENQAQLINKQAGFMVGSQRAVFAANGVEVDSGSAAEIQRDTRRMARLDAMMSRNNALREAWGYKAQALNYRMQGSLGQAAANLNAQNTITVGGLKATGQLANSYAYTQMDNYPKDYSRSIS
jgi:hypothetical protein